MFLLGCGKHFGFHALKKKSKVLYIDTEQSKRDQRKNMRYIYSMCAKNRMEPLLKKVVPNGRLKGSYIGKIDPTQFGRKDMRYWDRKILPKDQQWRE